MFNIVLAEPHLAEEWGAAFEPALAEWRALRDALDRVAKLTVLQPASWHYGDAWVRDTGPIVVDGQARALRFNGWGGKYQMPGDDSLAPRLAAHFGYEIEQLPLVAEGGAFEVDAERLVLTTRSAVLSESRNPGLSEAQAGAHLRALFGAEEVLWFDDGLAHDHTDGHIDNALRFAPGKQLILMSTDRPEDPQYAALQKLAAAVETQLQPRGYTPVCLPTPGLLRGNEGEVLPASYCNFVRTESHVFVPVFGVEADAQALQLLARAFPDHRVEGLASRHLLCGGGSLHCLSLEVPFHGLSPLQEARA